MDAILEFYSGSTKYGTSGNPMSFSGVIAGSGYEHPLNPFYLWNDYSGISGSIPARDITAQVLAMWIQNELLGTSDGSASQTYTAAFPPVIADEPDENEINSTLMVGSATWTRVDNLTLYGPVSTVYLLDVTSSQVTFGDGIHGAIPPNGQDIKFTYMPDTLVYGNEVYDNLWLGIKSFGCTSNPVSIVNEQQQASDVNTVVISSPKITSVSGVWLAADVGHSGTNYYIGGSYISTTGIITVGIPLPSANVPVTVTYVAIPIDDLEAGYTQIGDDATHTFPNAIQSNNAKLIYLNLTVPPTATPSGGGQVNFRIRLSYSQ